MTTTLLLLLVLLLVPLLLPVAPAHADRGPARPSGPTTIDTLDGTAPPGAAEIAETIRSLDPVVLPLEVSAPRSLRKEAEEGGRTTLTVATDVLFAFDSAELTPRAHGTLRELVADVESALGGEAPDGAVLVVGHTDSVGTDAYNQDLSERRAEAVADVLADVLAGDVAITTEGRGEEEPVADEGDGDPAAAARNRRVEIVFEG